MKYFKTIALWSCLSVIVFQTASPIKVLAINAEYYAGNDIEFYNPEDGCGNASSDSSSLGNDIVTSPDKTYGTGAATPGAGHDWKPAVATSFGGAGEYQATSFGQNTKVMDDAGVFYFAILPKDYSSVKMNPNTPKEIVDAVKSGKLKPKDKLIFKNGDKYAIGSWLDVGPGATGEGRWLDLGQKLHAYLDVPSSRKIQWDFVSNSDASNTNSGQSSTGTVATPNSLHLKQSDKLKQIYDLLVAGGLNATQASAVMGNMYAESSFIPDRHEVGNDIGYGLVQWSFGRRDRLEAYAVKKGIDKSDIGLQIEFLLKEYNGSYKDSLDKTAFKDATDIEKATYHWMKIFEAPKEKPANDPARLNSKRIPAAKVIFGFYSGSTPSSTSGDGCSSTDNGVVANDIVQTALNLALKTPASNGMNSANDATPEYIAALDKYNHGANPADCGIFVATVVIASGADTKYPKAGTSLQMDYVKSNSAKYKVIESPKRSDLQPGDILIVHNGINHHTLIYTGESSYPVVDASQDQRVPSVRKEGSLTDMLSHSGVIIARLIK